MKTKAPIFTKVMLGILLAGSIAACNKPKTDDKIATAVREVRTLADRKTDAATDVEVPGVKILGMCRGS